MRKYNYFTLNKNSDNNYYVNLMYGYKIKKYGLTFYATKIGLFWHVTEASSGLCIFDNIKHFRSISNMLDKEVCTIIFKLLNTNKLQLFKKEFEALKREFKEVWLIK